MQATHTQFKFRALQASWQTFDAMVHLRLMHNEMEYVRMVELMNSLLDVTGDHEDHPLVKFARTGGRIGLSVRTRAPCTEPASPKDALRFLMEARGLKQENLSAIAPQSNFSAILAVKRNISATMAGKLGKLSVSALRYSYRHN